MAHAGGRPSKFDSVDQEKMEILYRRGFDDKEVARFFDVTEQTINNWKKSNPKFFEALKEWKLDADGKVEKSLYERACGYSHPEEKIFCQDGRVTKVQTIRHYPPDPVSCIFWLKNRQPSQWRDKTEHNHNINVNVVDRMNRARDVVHARMSSN